MIKKEIYANAQNKKLSAQKWQQNKTKQQPKNNNKKKPEKRKNWREITMVLMNLHYR